MLAALPLNLAFASSGAVLLEHPASTDTVQSGIDAGSQNASTVMQQGGSGAVQNAQLTGSAATVVGSTQVVDTEHQIFMDQHCTPGSGTQLCFQDASPTAATVAVQEITASSANVLGVLQQGGTGSVQNAGIAASALTAVAASQIVTPQTIVAIFQDCTMQSGTCVQRSLPEVLTLASQVITASALNTIRAAQIAGSGSVQDVGIAAAANVSVAAEQFVSPRNFLYLSQLCAVDVGLCIQRAIPVVTTAVRQVIQAQTGNDIGVLQMGGYQQNADVMTDAGTDVASLQNVFPQSEIHTIQHCDVRQGLCLQINEAGQPYFIFSDGDTVASGAYVGTLDDSPLATDYSRTTVAKVAGGICGESGQCSMLDKLLFWLFGPEPVATSNVEHAQHTEGEDSARRGHQTNVLGASARFLALHSESDIAPAAFGGSAGSVLTESQRSLFCSMRKAIPAGSDAAVWQWTASELAALTGLSPSYSETILKDPSLCPQPVAAVDARLAKLAQITFFPVDDTGPVSSNPLWNACIRGLPITLDMIKQNQDRDEDGKPRSCADYHTQESWYQPDLHVFFTWNGSVATLQLPEGYVQAPVQGTL
jgi:hypothetical protein